MYERGHINRQLGANTIMIKAPREYMFPAPYTSINTVRTSRGEVFLDPVQKITAH